MAQKHRGRWVLGLAVGAMAVLATACGSDPSETLTATSGDSSRSPTSISPPVTPPVSVTTKAVTATTTMGFPRTTVPTASISTIASDLGATGVRGTVLFGPVCPVERIPPDPGCAPRPGVARIRVVRADGNAAAEGVSVFVDGRFSLPVAPGTYQVTAAPSTSGPGRGCQVEPLQVTVVAGYFASVSVTCDTGIR